MVDLLNLEAEIIQEGSDEPLCKKRRLLNNKMKVALAEGTDFFSKKSKIDIRTLVSCLRLRAHPHACTASFSVFYFYRPTVRPRRTSPPSECQRNNTAILFATAARRSTMA